jgi:hypothetical protein
LLVSALIDLVCSSLPCVGGCGSHVIRGSGWENIRPDWLPKLLELLCGAAPDRPSPQAPPGQCAMVSPRLPEDDRSFTFKPQIAQPQTGGLLSGWHLAIWLSGTKAATECLSSSGLGLAFHAREAAVFPGPPHGVKACSSNCQSVQKAVCLSFWSTPKLLFSVASVSLWFSLALPLLSRFLMLPSFSLQPLLC